MHYEIKEALRITNAEKGLAALIITSTDDVFAPGGDLGGRYACTGEPVTCLGLAVEGLDLDRLLRPTFGRQRQFSVTTRVI